MVYTSMAVKIWSRVQGARHRRSDRNVTVSSSMSMNWRFPGPQTSQYSSPAGGIPIQNSSVVLFTGKTALSVIASSALPGMKCDSVRPCLTLRPIKGLSLIGRTVTLTSNESVSGTDVPSLPVAPLSVTWPGISKLGFQGFKLQDFRDDRIQFTHWIIWGLKAWGI